MTTTPTYRIYALKIAGPLLRSRALVAWLRDWDVQVTANHYFWVVQGEDDVIVVDSGYTPEIAQQRNISTYVSPVDLLARIGIDAAAVPHVVLTHLHWDHAAGMSLFPNARFYLQEAEYRFWIEDPKAQRPAFANPFTTDESYRIALSKLKGTARLALLQGDREILPGVECLLAAGHTPALQAVAVNTEQGTAVVGSDCGHMFANYREDWPSCLIYDLGAWLDSFSRLRATASSLDLLFPGHDPLLTSGYPTVADGVTRLA